MKIASGLASPILRSNPAAHASLPQIPPFPDVEHPLRSRRLIRSATQNQLQLVCAFFKYAEVCKSVTKADQIPSTDSYRANIPCTASIHYPSFANPVNDLSPNDRWLAIVNSEIMCGVMDKETVGSGTKKSLFWDKSLVFPVFPKIK
ncbi:hypothetical protein B0H13DRAFT_1917212 [Mycena leptocephala]|nr:hypothetical protein B0H13DRAFT_1917212 [Mycena leptocephala]